MAKDGCIIGGRSSSKLCVCIGRWIVVRMAGLMCMNTRLSNTCSETFWSVIACSVHIIMCISDTVPMNNYDNNGTSPNHSYLSLEEMPTPINELVT